MHNIVTFDDSLIELTHFVFYPLGLCIVGVG
jgi:hypothetical protein